MEYHYSKPWEMLAALMTAVDSHRLVTHFDREHRSEHDEKLYETVRKIRRALDP